jgi:Mg2+/Co2+ transporter CorB
MVSPSLLLVGLLTVLVLLACSAFFSSSEIALFSLQPAWIEERARSGEHGAVTVAELRSNPHRLLVTLLVGNTIVNIAISSIVTALLVGVVPAGPAVVLATLATTLLILIFGEIVPKAFGLGNAETWTVTVAGAHRYVEGLLSPWTTVMETVTTALSRPLQADEEIEKPYLD